MKRTFSKGFSWAELTSNENGKTSASGLSGLIIVSIGGLSFLAGMLLIILGRGEQDILIQSIALVYAGAALLGIRKLRREPNYYERDYNGLHELPYETGSSSENQSTTSGPI